MQPSNPPNFRWLLALVWAVSLPNACVLAGLAGILLQWGIARLTPPTGIVDTTLENLLFFLGMYFAVPCGLAGLAATVAARKRGLLSRARSTAAIALALISLLFGLAAWAFIYMMSKFVF